ncbi:MAG: Ig-like domain-containing protein [Nitrospirae bacterium]|nr:Ig-like domain-containing protein [Nitrospirota bacterium]
MNRHRYINPRQSASFSLIIALLSVILFISGCGGGGGEGITDTTSSPVVISVSPAADSRQVAVNSAVTIEFSRPMDPMSVTGITVTVQGVKGFVTVNGASATFIPMNSFDYARTYTVTITRDVKDSHGIPLENSVTWDFTTAPPPNSLATYSHLLIVYPHTNAEYVEQGTAKRYAGSITESHTASLLRAFLNFSDLAADASDGVVDTHYDIIVSDRIIEKVSPFGDYFWLSYDDVRDDLGLYAPKGKYDSVHIVWNSGPIPAYFGLGGVFINDGTTTYSSIITGEQWWWFREGRPWGEVFLHEWLHGASNYYENLGFTMPVGNLHAALEHGYPETEAEGWMNWYRAYMRGQVWEPLLSSLTGIPGKAWSMPTPRQT